MADGVWGEGTVDELANYIKDKMPGIGGFNRRGLYRMKQFYETYFIGSECYKLWLEVQAKSGHISIVSPAATQTKKGKKTKEPIVSPMATQSQSPENEYFRFLSTVMTQITWSNHMEILSGAKSAEGKVVLPANHSQRKTRQT